LRAKAKTDLVYLAQNVVMPPNEFKDASRSDYPYLQHLFAWMKSHERSLNKLILLPRGHRKTTYCTALDSLQIALPDDLGICAYPRNLGPDVRIGIIHETDSMAQKILEQIKIWVSDSPELRFLFPEIIPSSNKFKDNATQFELAGRKLTSSKEKTFETFSVGSRAQGRHYDRLKLDDIYGSEARDSPTTRAKTIQWFDEIRPFLDNPSKCGFDLIGTRWDSGDIYNHAMKKFGNDLPRYIRSVIEFNKATQKYEPIFPELFTLESLAHERKNRKAWTSFWLNAPDFRESRDLEASWIRNFEWLDNRKTKLVGFTGEERLKRHVDDLDKLLFIDPATVGDCGWVITGADRTEHKPKIFCLESFRGPIPPEEMIPKIFAAVEKWGLRAVVIEEVLFSMLYRKWLESEMRHRGVFFRVIPAKTRQKAKDSRVLALAPYFAAGQIFIHQEQEALLEEYDQFSPESTYHILDALAYGPEFWRAAADRGSIARRTATENKFRAGMDSITGYTRIAM
jgi:hypothetical protein